MNAQWHQRHVMTKHASLEQRLLIRNLRWPGLSLCHAALALSVAFMLVAPAPGWAQPLQSFEDLGLRVNFDDQLEVEDQSGAKATGRLIRLTRNDMAIRTDAGEQRFASDGVRRVAVRSHPLRRGALVGAGVFAVLGAVAVCSHRGGGDCAIVGPFGAAPIGAGVGLAIGGLIPQMKPVYRAPEKAVSVPPSRVASGARASLLEDLALWINLDDQLRVEDRSGLMTTGRLTHLTTDEITIQTDAGEKHYTRETARQIAVRHHPFRMATLIGAGAGAAWGAVAACTGETRNECADASMIGGAFGAGLGLAVGALVQRTTIVYPEPEKRTFVRPAISRGAVSVRVSRRW
jgi:hypothetical protein